MHALLLTIGGWGHAAGAFLFAALAIWQVHRRERAGRVQAALALGLILTSIWSLISVFTGAASTATALAETLRNAAWLTFMFLLMQSGEGRDQPRAINVIYATLALLLLGQLCVDIVLAQLPVTGGEAVALNYGSYMPRMIFAVGVLVLVHNLYTISTPEARWSIGLPMGALALMWTYDLNLYTIAYLTQSLSMELVSLRGVALIALAPIFAVALMRNRIWRISLSRSAAFQSVSLSVIGVYLLSMFLLANAIQLIGGEHVALGQVTLIFAMCLIALLVIPSGGFRSWLRVQISKHFFKHRYDYRAEWMRFTETIGEPGTDAVPLDGRVIQALADICRSRKGLLLTADGEGRLRLQARWNWPDIDVPANPVAQPLADFLRTTGYIVELDTVRGGQDHRIARGLVPRWLVDCPEAWAVIPFIHFNRLVGLAVLAAPETGRRLDWEDLDMFRVVGRQVASYLAEANGQQALMEAREFDSFNRRFAFIIHDIKNLVSQLSLLARNAQRHADNPEFRADMIETLQISVDKMNDLLARLSQQKQGRRQQAAVIDLSALVGRMAASRALSHPVEVDLAQIGPVRADPQWVETILAHLVQNAIDASTPDQPVRLATGQQDGFATVSVIDHGCGMDEAFLRDQLFRPFASNKEGGFGIGAYEALTLAQSLGGRLEVESRKGKGSHFTLFLPMADGSEAGMVSGAGDKGKTGGKLEEKAA